MHLEVNVDLEFDGCFQIMNFDYYEDLDHVVYYWKIHIVFCLLLLPSKILPHQIWAAIIFVLQAFFVSKRAQLDFERLASRFRHRLACQIHRKLGMGITKDWYQKFVSNCFSAQYHTNFWMVFLTYPNFRLLSYFHLLDEHGILKSRSSRTLSYN